MTEDHDDTLREQPEAAVQSAENSDPQTSIVVLKDNLPGLQRPAQIVVTNDLPDWDPEPPSFVIRRGQAG